MKQVGEAGSTVQKLISAKIDIPHTLLIFHDSPWTGHFNIKASIRAW